MQRGSMLQELCCKSYAQKFMFEAKKSRSTNFHTRNDFTISFCGDFLFLPTECNLFLRVPSARIFLIFPVLHYNFCVRGIG